MTTASKEYQRAYYAANREHINELARIRRAKKGVATKRKATVKVTTQWQRIKEKSKVSVLPVFRDMLSSAKHRAKKVGRKFEIDEDHLCGLWVRQNQQCALTGDSMATEMGAGKDKVSIDRVDPAKGYVKGNIQLVTTVANTLKLDLRQEELVEFCVKVVQMHRPDLIKA